MLLELSWLQLTPSGLYLHQQVVDLATEYAVNFDMYDNIVTYALSLALDFNLLVTTHNP